MNLAIYETQLLRKRRIPSPGRIMCSQDAVKVCSDMAMLDREHLVRLDLDARNNLIGRETVHIGSADSAVISAATILRGAIINGAVKFLIVHNHPSGDSSPSKEDVWVTERIKQAGEAVGLPLVDSLIVGQDGAYYSCTDQCGGRVPNHPKQRSLVEY